MKQFKKIGILIIVLVTPALINFTVTSSSSEEETKILLTANSISVTTAKTNECSTSISKLWEDDLILSGIALNFFQKNDSQFSQTVKTFCDNNTNLKSAIQFNYGKRTSEKFTELMATHITLTIDLAIAGQSQNKYAIETSTQKWFNNSEEISALIEKSETTNLLSGMTVLMNDNANRVDQKKVEFLAINTSEKNQIRPAAVVTKILHEESTQIDPKKFERDAIHCLHK